jgi:hypothetical protein
MYVASLRPAALYSRYLGFGTHTHTHALFLSLSTVTIGFEVVFNILIVGKKLSWYTLLPRQFRHLARGCVSRGARGSHHAFFSFPLAESRASIAAARLLVDYVFETVFHTVGDPFPYLSALFRGGHREHLETESHF